MCVCVFITAGPSTKRLADRFLFFLLHNHIGRKIYDVIVKLVTLRTAVQGGHGLVGSPCSVLTRVLLTRMNAAAGVGCLGYGRVPEVGKRSRSGDQAQRLGCVDEVPSRGFPCVTPLLRIKAQGSRKGSTCS